MDNYLFYILFKEKKGFDEEFSWSYPPLQVKRNLNREGRYKYK